MAGRADGAGRKAEKKAAKPTSLALPRAWSAPIVVFAALGIVGGLFAWRSARHDVRNGPGLSVLLITVDTLRADALGAYGKRDASTPWMDRLAAAGVRYDDAHAHN